MQVLGCCIIGYMAWVLASGVTVTQFLEGRLVNNNTGTNTKIIFTSNYVTFFQIFTYVVVALGFVLFFSGLLGWVGGASESPCLVRLFLISVILSIVVEIGGIVALNIVKLQVSAIFNAI